MNLRDRLDRALGPAPPASQGGRAEDFLQKDCGCSSLRERLDNLVGDRAFPEPKRKRRACVSMEEAVGGSLVEGSDGTSLIVRNHYPYNYAYGDVVLSDIHRLSRDTLALMGGDPRLAGDGIEELLFLDTETTGLSGGAGTCAFLVGAGFFKGDSFHVHQFFMRDFNEEKAMLSHFREILLKAGSLVTYNGKAFDAPLLEGRFILQRRKSSLLALPHLDLLFPSRKLWKGRFEDCRLVTLEEKVLGLPRHDDIDGSLIPQCYFDYLHSGDTSMIGRIFTHNRHDIIALAALTAKIGLMLENPLNENGQGLVRLGRMHSERGDKTAGRLCLEKAIVLDLDQPDRILAAKELSLQYRREGRYAESAQILEKLLQGGSCSDASVFIELAKHYEHREKDCGKALATVISILGHLPSGQLSLQNALLHRKARLERKIWGQTPENMGTDSNFILMKA